MRWVQQCRLNCSEGIRNFNRKGPCILAACSGRAYSRFADDIEPENPPCLQSCSVGFDVFGKTIGIIGTGRIGQITAQIFRGFDANVIAYDPFPNSTWANAHGVRYTSLDDLFSQSDVLSLHLPLTPETKHLINSTTLALTKRGVYLVNTSRGKLIETTALIAAIKTGQVGGVALDVYEEEEGVFFHDLSGIVPQDQELSHLLIFPNVLITSHQAFLTQEALSEIARVTVENLLRFHRQEAFLEGTSL